MWHFTNYFAGSTKRNTWPGLSLRQRIHVLVGEVLAETKSHAANLELAVSSSARNPMPQRHRLSLSFVCFFCFVVLSWRYTTTHLASCIMFGAFWANLFEPTSWFFCFDQSCFSFIHTSVILPCLLFPFLYIIFSEPPGQLFSSHFVSPALYFNSSWIPFILPIISATFFFLQAPLIPVFISWLYFFDLGHT